MTKIISFANHKGGVGKSTTASSLGYILAGKGKRVLLVDLDAQANLTRYYFNDEEFDKMDCDFYKALVSTTKKPVAMPVYNVRENLDIVPSSVNLANAETEVTGRTDQFTRLRKLIAPVADKYEYILIDCPPSLGSLVTNALAASTDVYIVTTAETMAFKGLYVLEELINLVKEDLNPQLKLSGLIITMWSNNNLSKTIANTLQEDYKDIIFSTKIRKTILVPESQATNLGLIEYAPKATATIDYKAIADEMVLRELK